MYRSNADFLMEHLLILAPNQSHDVGGEYAHVPQFLLLSFHLLVECLTLIVTPIDALIFPPIVPPIVAPIVTLLATTKVVVLILDLCFMLILLKLEFLRL
jgi:hypothetical protein